MLSIILVFTLKRKLYGMNIMKFIQKRVLKSYRGDLMKREFILRAD